MSLRLSDEQLFDFLRCPRRSWLEAYGDPSRREPPSEYLLKLGRDSRQHRAEAAAAYDPVAVTARDPAGAAAETLALMKDGVAAIAGGWLQGEAEGVTLEARPDLLLRQPGRSWWGDWHYVPLVIKLGKSPKPEYGLQVALAALLLEQNQGLRPREAWLLLRQKGLCRVNLDLRLEQLREVLPLWRSLLRRNQPPEPFIARKRCSLCQWHSDCYAQARAVNHLCLLPGVSERRYELLSELGVTALAELAAADSDWLEQFEGLEDGVGRKLIRQARSTLSGQPIQHGAPAFVLPRQPLELYFDIEAEPERDLAYLHGVLVVEGDRSHFRPLLAEQPEAEAEAWQGLLDLFERFDRAPIFHFCDFEVSSLRKLGDRFGTEPERVERIRQRMVDLHAAVVQSVTLPVESYALKHLARWLGFDWRDDEANGAESISWYDHWLNSGDRRHLERILIYNEDDCRATWHLKQWLTDFLDGAMVDGSDRM